MDHPNTGLPAPTFHTALLCFTVLQAELDILDSGESQGSFMEEVLMGVRGCCHLGMVLVWDKPQDAQVLLP